MIQANLTKR